MSMTKPKTKVTKRAAEQPSAIPPAKRLATKTRSEDDVVEIEEPEPYHITVELHSKFNIYPKELRLLLAQSCKTTLRTMSETLASGKTGKPRYTYSIVIAENTRQAITPIESNSRIFKDDISTVSSANIKLLEHDLEINKATKEKPVPVKLQTQEGLANPEFVQLHSVRHGELGWGLDCYDCLSLYTTRVADGKLKEHVMYVKRTEAKAEVKVEELE